MQKLVYSFEEGNANMKDILGGKGSGLAEMTNLGLPVPFGFTITTQACKIYNNTGIFPIGMEEEVLQHLKKLEEKTGKIFGNKENPLLISVRSGAKFSMPGMMDTILNLGLNDETVKGLIRQTKNERFCYDAYRRFIQMFSKVVLGVKHEKFEEIISKYKQQCGVKLDTELNAGCMKKIVSDFKELIKEERKNDFPQDVFIQLKMSIKAVFDSWQNERARDYRKQNNIPEDLGTAVNIQCMVFGNMGNDSGTGVLFTRNPLTGENKLYGEFLMNAQGEDVVAGIRTPIPIENLKKENKEVFRQLNKIAKILEQHYKEMQDIEFTIEKGKLFVLQTRTGKRTSQSAVKIAVDMVKEGIITKETALMRIQPEQLDQLLHKRIDPNAKYFPITRGIGASPGVAIGKVIFDVKKAIEKSEKGENIILVRVETNPDDYKAMVSSKGVLTSRGGATSHAAVVARSEGKPCVVGCDEIKIDETNRLFVVKDKIVKEESIITIDGTTGDVILGEVATIEPELSEEIKELLSWADKIRKLGVRANTDTPKGAEISRKFGAEGIGLCRTERMFNQPERLPIVQKMILAESYEERMKYINQLLPMQKNDFKEILKVMQGLPVTIRLLDPPLHEFLPKLEKLIEEVDDLERFSEGLTNIEIPPSVLKELRKNDNSIVGKFFSEIGETKEKRTFELMQKKELLEKVRNLMEVNPMLGHRGVRLGLTYPEIYDMQITAIFSACAELIKEKIEIYPEIMIPQVCTLEELKFVYSRLIKIKEEIETRNNVKINFKFGTMIEVVRACMRAGKLAEIAEFFSFGTNDLTQATFSFSREDAEAKFLPLYNERKILKDNPFQILDRKGVGRLMMITVEFGRKTRKDLKIGICGEHGGEPSSIEFCHEIGLDYVSCSPYRVPIARLSSAQAVLKGKVEEGRDK